MENRQESGPDEVSITRTRWDWYFLPTIFVLALFSMVLWWKFQLPRFLGGPLLLVLLWLNLRLVTPKTGLVVKRISAEPGRVAFLYFLLAWYVLAMAGIYLFRFLPLQLPLSNVLGTFALVFWIVILLFRANKEDQRRKARDSEAAPSAMQKWGEN